MTAPLMDRIIAAIDTANEAQLALLELADELRDNATRALGITARLMKEVKGGLDAPGVVRLPRGVTPPSAPSGRPIDADAATADPRARGAGAPVDCSGEEEAEASG